MNRQLHPEKGYVLLGVLFLVSLSLVITAGMLDASGTNAKTRALVTTQAEYYYEVEETVNRVVGWLQTHSKDIVSAFDATNFSVNFTLGSPALGDNEGEHFAVPTMVKMRSTNHSVMLSNNTFFGTSYFPGTTNIDTGVSFDPVASFENADLGGANARIILIWARHTSGSYEPVFRIDVITGNNPDRGVHSYSHVYTTLVSTGGTTGFYGRDELTLDNPNNTCYSYQYTNTGGVWDRGAPRSNCPVSSDGPIDIASKVHGTGKTITDDGIEYDPPGGEISGDICDGAGCHNYSLPTVPPWSSQCPGNTTDITITTDTVLAPGCYRTITVNNNRTLTLSNTEDPYYIQSIDWGGVNAAVAFGTIPVGEKVTVFAESLGSNDTINGNRIVNMNNAPHQLDFYYTGTDPLTLNGTADMGMNLIAPNAPISINGNFNYYGGVQTPVLDVSGNAHINYDESLGITPVLSDMNFALKKTSQRYR